MTTNKQLSACLFEDRSDGVASSEHGLPDRQCAQEEIGRLDRVTRPGKHGQARIRATVARTHGAGLL
jgi:hypothetical protein